MKYAYLFLLIATITATACQDHPAQKSDAVRVPRNDSSNGSYYKRYSGTIAGKDVVVHLLQYGNMLEGSYQYTSYGRSIKLTSWADTLKNGQHYLTELVPADQATNEGDAHWLISLSADTATGKWISGNGSQQLDIHLEEAYPAGSYPLDAYYYTDTASMFKKNTYPKAWVSYGMLWPASSWEAEPAAFVKSRITLDMNLEGVDGMLAGLKTRAFRYFGNYRISLHESIDTSAGEEKRKEFMYQYNTSFRHFILMNDDNWLVMENATSDYTGGAHGMYGSTYHNLDISGTKEWRIQDIITDTTALKPSLQLAARAYFKLPATEPLNGRLLVSEVPPTANFYLTAKGIAFVYNPYEIASYADGMVQLFIPYDKLLPWLTPAFKKRMNLAENAGVTVHIRSAANPKAA